MSEVSLPVVAVHGGATSFDQSKHEAILDVVEGAATTGFCALDRGGSALDAAEAAVWSLEESGLFTAGRGATPNANGEIELDSMIMDGRRLQSGAVMAVRGVWHPISLARYVLERTSNSQFASDGAYKLYRRMISEGYRQEYAEGANHPSVVSKGCDTVGCVVVDSRGSIVSASSTSGWTGKLAGRVGDSPIIGAGVYANEVAGATCTGRGEQILRITMARIAVHYVEEGSSLSDAVTRIMRVLRDRTSGEAGLIMADSRGNIALAHDTPHMPVAVARSVDTAEYSAIAPRSFSSLAPDIPG